jgi:hypothetical protein
MLHIQNLLNTYFQIVIKILKINFTIMLKSTKIIVVRRSISKVEL